MTWTGKPGIGLGLLILALFLSCRSPLPPTAPEPVGDTVSKMEPRILFLTYEIFADSTGTAEIRLLDQRVVNGKLKPDNRVEQFRVGDFRCVQVHPTLGELEAVYAENPMVKTVEYVDEEGQLMRRQVKQEKAQFFVRMQLDPKATGIVIEQVAPVGQTKRVLTTHSL